MLRERGKGFRKERWYSFCSMHIDYDEKCPRCCAGSWENVWVGYFSSFVYKVAPRLWKWWVNR